MWNYKRIILYGKYSNDSYSRDTSIKIRSHLDVKRRNGEFIGSFAVYGYAKDPENKNRLVVDPEAAEVVREIFSRRIAGQSCQNIADDLNALGVLSPMEYKRSRGINFKTGYQVQSKAKWSARAVLRILENEVYLGVMTQGKRTTPNYKVRTVIERPPDAWIRVEGTHEAIISQEDFQLAARLKEKDTRKAPGTSAVYPLSGMVCCGDCKSNMVRKTTLCGDKTYGYFICAAHRADKSVCSTHSISEAKLEQAVLEGINLHIRMVAELRGTLEAISRRPMQRVTVERMDHHLENLRQELSRKQEIRDNLYRRYASGEVSSEDFYDFKRIFTRDCEEIEQSIEAQQRQLEEVLSNTSPDSPWIEYFQRFGQIDALNRDVLVRPGSSLFCSFSPYLHRLPQTGEAIKG